MLNVSSLLQLLQLYESLINLNKEGMVARDGKVQDNIWRFYRVLCKGIDHSYNNTSDNDSYIDHTEDHLPFSENLNNTNVWSYHFRMDK